MNTEVYVKKENKWSTLKLVVCAAVCFAAVLLFSPEAGILRTIPFMLAAGVVSSFLGVQTAMSVSLTAVFCLCIYLVRGSIVGEALFFTLLAVLLLGAGIYAVKLCKLARKTQNSNVRKKCITLCVIAVLASVVLSLLLCGNPVSLCKRDSEADSYILSANEFLDSDVIEKNYTYYNALGREYRTHVTFRDGDDIIGSDNECYISFKNGIITDNVRDYYEDKMLAKAQKELSGAIVNVTSAFEITAAEIVLENNEFLSPSAQYKDYSSRIGYVVSFYSILENENDFLTLCTDAMKQLEKSDFDYKEIVFCGGNASEVLFAAQALPSMDYSTFESKYLADFDDFSSHFVNLEEDYGVTEELILEYWNNK